MDGGYDDRQVRRPELRGEPHFTRPPETRPEYTGTHTVVAMVPPTMKDEHIMAAVAEYTDGIRQMHAMDTVCAGFGEWCISTAVLGGRQLVNRVEEPMQWLNREDTSKGAHRLVAVVAARHWDFWRYTIARAIQSHCPQPPRDYIELDVEVDARNLGKAIGPEGRTVKRAHSRAKFYWDTHRPTEGLYTLWVPRDADAGGAREAYRGVLF